MKRSLLASTAAVGLGMLVSQPVLAQDSDGGTAITTGVEGASLEIKGGLEFYSGWRNYTGKGTAPSFDFREDLRLRIKGEVEEDDYTYGVVMSFNWGGGDSDSSSGRNLRTEEIRAYIRNPEFGSLEFGDDDGMSDNLTVYFPVVGSLGQLDADVVDFLPASDTSGFRANYNYKVFNSDDATKIMYLSPTFEGFLFGIGYTPQIGDEGNSFARGGEYDSFIEGGILFNTSEQGNIVLPEGLSALGSFTFTSANYNGDDEPQGSTREDIFEWGFGASISAVLPDDGGEVTVGGGIVDHDEDSRSNGEEFSWNFGARYVQGDVSAAFSFSQTNYDKSGDPTAYSWGAGVAYQLASGVELTADYITYEDDDTTSDGSVFILGTIVKF